MLLITAVRSPAAQARMPRQHWELEKSHFSEVKAARISVHAGAMIILWPGHGGIPKSRYFAEILRPEWRFST
jgi:hypothetical protein